MCAYHAQYIMDSGFRANVDKMRTCAVRSICKLQPPSHATPNVTVKEESGLTTVLHF